MILRFLNWLIILVADISIDIITVIMTITVAGIDYWEGKRYDETFCSKDCKFLASSYDYLWKRYCRYYSYDLATFNGDKQITCDTDYDPNLFHRENYTSTDRFKIKRCHLCKNKGCHLN